MILNMKIRSFIILIGCLISQISAVAQNPSPMAVADTLYSQGKYAEAADAYLALAKVDGTSAGLYCNLANSYAQIGNYGAAILYYSRANRLDPSNRQIKNNLQYFSSKVEDSNRAELRGKKTSVAPDPETFFVTAHRLIAEDVKSNFWATLSVICFIFFLGGVAVYFFCSSVPLRKTGFFGGIALFLGSVMFLVFALMGASQFDSHDHAVLMTYKTPLLIEPSADAKPASSQLCQGTRFEIVAEETNVEGNPTWYKVRLNADIEGWLRSSDLEII